MRSRLQKATVSRNWRHPRAGWRSPERVRV